MNKKHKIFLFYIPLLYLFNSCVYYNTFYNAEVSFKKANKLIEESPVVLDDEVPAQAKKLLNQVIINARIVIDKYPNSKYVDDAYFILAKSTFLIGEFANSEKYINKLLTEFPNSIYYFKSRIWLSYNYLKMNNLDQCEDLLLELYNNTSSKDELFLINKVSAELSLEQKNIDKTYDYYEKALIHTNNKSTKTSILNKLFITAEKNYNLDKIIYYLSELEVYAPDNMKKDVMIDWIRYNRKAGNFNSILTKIDILLSSSEYQSIYMKLELERAKVYLDKKDFSSAKLFLSEFTQLYQRKNESAEAFYHLGYISLMEDFNLDLSKEYFEKSKKERSTSEYGKLSKEMLGVIDDFESLQYEFDLALGNNDILDNSIDSSKIAKDKRIDDMSIPLEKNPSSPDSLLFTIAEKLLFDFGKIELALQNFEKLVDDYENSAFRMQSMYILDNYIPNADWGNRLKIEYPGIDRDKVSFSSNDDEVIQKRNFLWNKLDNINFNAEDLALSLNQLYKIEKDTVALYEFAFIQDQYLNNIELCTKSYQEFVSYNFDVERTSQATRRLAEIEESLITEKQLIEQKKYYSQAVALLNSGIKLDSVVTVLDSTLIGNNSAYKKSAQEMKNKLNTLISLIEEVNAKDDSSYTSEHDSLLYSIGDIYLYDFNLGEIAFLYFDKIISNTLREFRYKTLVSLSQIDSSYKVQLLKEFPDSTYSVTQDRIGYKILEDVYSEKFNDICDEKLIEIENYLQFFHKEDYLDAKLDSTTKKIEIENQFIKVDSLNNIN